DVLALQQALSRRGYLGADGVDGVVGAATRRAIRSLQIDKGLPADGYVDSSSLPSLMRSLAA
ncbi:MAG: peptidoglycan-binding protein, partial [Alphaproteobacteria bacterium]|nr:peptidoglycan-binding protein [Alphaproteobacteria bacterium]